METRVLAGVAATAAPARPTRNKSLLEAARSLRLSAEPYVLEPARIVTQLPQREVLSNGRQR